MLPFLAISLDLGDIFFFVARVGVEIITQNSNENQRPNRRPTHEPQLRPVFHFWNSGYRNDNNSSPRWPLLLAAD